MAAHVCQECGLMHDAVTPQESEAVLLARIAKEQAIEVERIRARAQRAELATAEVIAETEADAEVGAAAAEAEVLGTLLNAEPEPDDSEPEPIIIDAPAVEQTEIDEDAPPPADEHSPHEPTAPRKPRGLGMW